MKATAHIKIEFSPGDEIEEAFTEAIRLAKQLQVTVEFKFNGITCIARANGDPKKGVRSYEDTILEDQPLKMAFS